MKIKEKFNLYNIIFMIFLDFLGMTLLLPILTPLIFDASSPLVSPTYSDSEKSVLLGLILAAFPLAQFIGAPYFGALSDRIGRKNTLLFSMTLAAIGYAISIGSIYQMSLLYFFVGRILIGFASGHISVAQSVIVDNSNQSNLNQNFGLMGAAIGVGFIMGPFVGGVLANKNIFASANYASPFLIALILTLLNIMQLFLLFQDTKLNKLKAHDSVNPISIFNRLFKDLNNDSLKKLYIVSFLYLMGWFFFTEFYPLWLIKKLKFTEESIGYFFVYIGIWIILTQIFTLKWITKKYQPLKILRFSLFFLSISSLLMLLPNTWLALLLITPIQATLQASTLPTMLTIISQYAPKEAQGTILGLNASLQSIAMMLPPLISGTIASYNYGLPTIIGAGFIVASWFYLNRIHKTLTELEVPT